jgi:predicted nucleotidyltransferase
MSTRKMLLKEEIERFVTILKQNYTPDKIILFGSLSSGNIRDWSDIDIIIVKETEKSFYERLREVYLLLNPRVGIDILVYTPKEYELLQTRLFFREEVVKKGRLLYERR